MTAAPPRRVLLVEDHAALRRFVELALQPLPLAVHAVDAVAAAQRWIDAEGLPDLLLTDLMLPDGSGLDLVRALRADGHGEDRLPVIVLSAAVRPAQREALAALRVAGVLTKPVPLNDLLSCVQGALDAAPATAPAADPVADPVAEHFGGDRALFEAFAASCRQQIPADIAAAQAALARDDARALGIVAHSLKTVLTLLGDADGADTARRLELAGGRGDGAVAADLWPALQERLRRHL